MTFLGLRVASFSALGLLGLLGLLGASVPQTYAGAGDRAVATMQSKWYVEGTGWRNCLDSSACGASDTDWGSDSMTYAIYDRWQTTHDANLVPAMLDLGEHLPNYRTSCDSPHRNCTWSDVPLWDSIAAIQAYTVTGNAGLLRKAEDGFAYVDASPAFRLGSCPSIDYQQAYGAVDKLKTLESDSNYIKSAILIYRATNDGTYLAKAVSKYAAVRQYFLDPHVPLYTVYVFDADGACMQVPHRFYSSVNGNMIWNGWSLYRTTGAPTYQSDALDTANAVITLLSDANGIHADMQAENDLEEPLVVAMHDIAKDGRYGPAKDWILANAAAALREVLPDGSFGRFWDGPVAAGMVTAFQTNGGFALMFAAADLAGDAPTRVASEWTGDRFVTKALNTSAGSNSVTFTGSAIAFTGAIGDRCCQPGHARVYIDGVETVDGTGIWQNKSSTGIRIPRSILFAWRWQTAGTHTVSFGPAAYNPKEGGTYLNITGYYVM